VEHCARHYNCLLVKRPVSTQPQTAAAEATDLKSLQAALSKSRSDFRRSIAALDDAHLDEPCFDGMNVEEFVLMAIRHEAWHAGQIVIARRLYRARAHRDAESTR
jgi:uncharacterized damage-inducible protein DinB